MQPELERLLVSLGRPALVAEAGGVGGLCQQGGLPLGLPTDRWPTQLGVPLLPILSLSTSELPFVPSFLADQAYWCFFIKPGSFEQGVASGSLVVRSYLSLDGLVPLPAGAPLRRATLGLRFSAVTDYPSSYAVSASLADRPALLAAYGSAESIRFPCHAGIKLGGYPHLIQPTAFLASFDPDFQVQLDSTEFYEYADSGVGYVYGGLSATIWESM
jgi:hypothetical protein